MRTIPVDTPSAHYKVYVGPALLPTLARRVAPYTRGRVFVLTSPPVWALWGERFLASFRQTHKPEQQPTILFLPPGEQAKRLSEVERLLEELARAGADRSALLIAFGGGIVGDVGGFLAAIYMRGLPYVQVPTTLLAQVDSSVGGKTGANLAAGKNLVGAFHHPQAVFADVDLLQTLPSNELRAGLMESVKAGIIRDPKLFRLLERRVGDLLAAAPDPALLTEVVARSVAMKAGVVGADEREGGLRMILNLGHTIGHAIEAVTRYRVLLHGEAVGWGMLVAIRIAAARGLMRVDEQNRATALIHACGPLPGFKAKAAQLLEAAGRDKKNAGSTRRFVLPTGIGGAVIVEDVGDQELLEAVEAVLALVADALRGGPARGGSDASAVSAPTKPKKPAAAPVPGKPHVRSSRVGVRP
ncbi:3-dehydroquinate synthase [Acidipila sp. EB88]|uniref:3-dehydroquinate synthase n=1 Tax=Acidipila sp. EB88 TaxID=2305226 RepID=UPI000F5F151F|nr:3-dehydroquinate synthase [Acidipila sp. EB88]RRA48681.1 3-dehydroquinate synthase [Acidipila sp. EB88]